MNVCAHINMQGSYEPVFVERFGNLFCKQRKLQEKGMKKNLKGGGKELREEQLNTTGKYEIGCPVFSLHFT